MADRDLEATGVDDLGDDIDGGDDAEEIEDDLEGFTDEAETETLADDFFEPGAEVIEDDEADVVDLVDDLVEDEIEDEEDLDDEDLDDEDLDDEDLDDEEDDLDDELDELLEEDEEVTALDEEEGTRRKAGKRGVRKVELISEDEFTCRSCFLVKKPSQLADREAMLCFDCV